MLAQQWNLPDEFVTLIAQHTKLEELLEGGPEDRGSACVALASLLPACTDEGWDEYEMFTNGYSKLTQNPLAELQTAFEKVDTDTMEFAPILRLPLPKRTLVEHMQIDTP